MANLTRPRLARHRHDAALRRGAARRRAACRTSSVEVKLDARQPARARRLRGLWPVDRPAGDAHGHRAGEEARRLDHRARQLAPPRAASATGPRWRSPQGLVSIHFVNVISFARVAPYGGADARFGTNPVCIGIPLPGEPPFVLDMATSAVAQGKLRVAHNKGEKIPLGWLIDARGQSDRRPALGRGRSRSARMQHLRRAQGLRPGRRLRAARRRAHRRRHLALRGRHQAARAERHALDPDRSGQRSAPGLRSSARRATFSTGSASRRRRRASTACASPASPSARRAPRASATAFPWTRAPGTKSAPPRPSSSSRPIASTRSRAVSAEDNDRPSRRARRAFARRAAQCKTVRSISSMRAFAFSLCISPLPVAGRGT